MRYIFIILLFCSSVYSSSAIPTFKDFKEQVRTESRMHDTSHLPDTTLVRFSKRALLYTSVDIGGVEMQWKFNTAARTAFYAIPDTITQIVHATLISEGYTFTIKAWHPEFYKELFPDGIEISHLEEASGGFDIDAVPLAYNYWADTIQLIPIPQKVDSVYLKTFVEYPVVDTTDAATIKFTNDAYTEAAITYCIYLIFKRSHMYESAALYLARYKELRTELKQAYTRKINAVRSQ